jgi:hypothetical protein
MDYTLVMVCGESRLDQGSVAFSELHFLKIRTHVPFHQPKYQGHFLLSHYLDCLMLGFCALMMVSVW